MKEHFELDVVEKNNGFKFIDLNSFQTFYKNFACQFYKGSMQDREINEALWGEFAYQTSIFKCDDKEKKSCIVAPLFLGNLIFKLHCDFLKDGEIKLSKFLSGRSVNAPLAFNEACEIYAEKIKKYKYYLNNPVKSITREIFNNVSNRMAFIKKPNYYYEHIYSSNFIYCTLIERMIIEKFKIELKDLLFKKFKKYFKHKSKMTIEKILEIIEKSSIKKERLQGLKDIFGPKSRLTLTRLIKIGFFQKCINPNFLTVLQVLFYEDILNLRNNMAHLNFENFDYFTLGICAILFQVLTYLMKFDFINIKNALYIFNNVVFEENCHNKIN